MVKAILTAIWRHRPVLTTVQRRMDREADLLIRAFRYGVRIQDEIDHAAQAVTTATRVTATGTVLAVVHS